MPKKATKKVTRLKSMGVEEAEANAGVDFAALFDKAMDSVAKKAGVDATELDGNLKAALVGVPFNNLALEVAFSENVLNLGRLYCLDGLQESCKSSFMWELARITDRANGFNLVIDTEHKATENLGQGIVGYSAYPRIQFKSPASFEQALQIVTSTVEAITKAPKGKTFPTLIGFDSAQGSAADAEIKNIDKDGTSGRSFPLPALLMAKYLPYVTSKISSLPIALFIVRHARLEASKMPGVMTAVAKGANELGFNAYKTFYMTATKVVQAANFGSRTVKIQTKKGTGEGVVIPVPLRWSDEILTHDDHTIESRRHFVFDWPAATFQLLTKPESCYVPTRVIKALKLVLGSMTTNAGKVSNKALGLDKASPQELHDALYDPTNAVLLSQLRAALNIRVGQAFRNGDNFDDLKSKQRAIILGRSDTNFKVEGEGEIPDLDTDEDETQTDE